MSVVAWAGTTIVPLFYVFTNWLGPFDYARPAWIGVLGLVPLAAGTWLLRRAHRDLGRYWSPTLQVVQEHRLVTSGVYATLRHPIYTAFLLTALAQVLMLPNWITGPAGLVAFALVYFVRIPAEERMMHEHYGAEYEDYMQKVGGVLPRIGTGGRRLEMGD
jgi:protein-S-isoprenylcysteine O-methyltransferase Ste14